MIRKLAELAVAIEVEMKSPQDIEGVHRGENFYILQSRPQVLLSLRVRRSDGEGFGERVRGEEYNCLGRLEGEAVFKYIV